MILKKNIIFVIGLLSIWSAYAVDDAPPTVYQPDYVYGATPGGVYMGDPMVPYDGVGMYMPNGEPMHEFNPQSGQPEQEFQFIQGQEQLMHDHSVQQVRQYSQEQQIGNNLEAQYHQQIASKDGESKPQAIVLPNL